MRGVAAITRFPAGYGSMAKLPITIARPPALASRPLLCLSSLSRRTDAAFHPHLLRCSAQHERHHRTEHVFRRSHVTIAPRCWFGKESVTESARWLTRSSEHSSYNIRRYSGRHEARDSLDKPASRRGDKPPSTPPLKEKLDSTRQRTKQITEKVRSSFTSLTPHENIYNIPNILTASRLIAAPVVGYLVLHEQHKYALALFAYAGITDLVDGWMARRFNLQTVVGSVIDPMADKVLMTVLTVTLAVKGFLPVYLATLILGRDVALAVAAIYYRYASLPAPKTFQRYWDFSLPSAEVHPTTMSKFNTFLQLLLIGSTLAYPVVTADSHHLGLMHDLGLENFSLDATMTYFQWIVAGTTVWSGLSYSYLKNAVKILGSDEKLKIKQGKRGRAIIGVTFGSIVAVAAWLAIKEQEQSAEKQESEN